MLCATRANRPARCSRYGCTIADPGGCDFDGREEDRGNGQSVPTPKLPVFALEPNIFIDKRVRLD